MCQPHFLPYLTTQGERGEEWARDCTPAGGRQAEAPADGADGKEVCRGARRRRGGGGRRLVNDSTPNGSQNENINIRVICTWKRIQGKVEFSKDIIIIIGT